MPRRGFVDHGTFDMTYDRGDGRARRPTVLTPSLPPIRDAFGRDFGRTSTGNYGNLIRSHLARRAPRVQHARLMPPYCRATPPSAADLENGRRAPYVQDVYHAAVPFAAPVARYYPRYALPTS